ncbi:SKI family transcriptional corepressor 1a [Echinococcus multilocularis]|uniref:SKI family transcriptional corepressor 1a n=1 Tax=Echinococcus multilocularis TaxID=6211 RepID=A0A068Y662_ECHMU|nr:SKI family transcriptional corepressor 1a [Echinococcus multilocularis]
MKDSSGKEKALPHSIHALLQPKGMEEPALSIFYLFGEPLVCLLLNGEERLCLAQISSRLLRGYSYNEIHNRRVALGITCVQCSPRQLELLRRVGAMPLSSRRCGTITKREAQRLVESFLQHLPAPPRLPENFAFEVVHHCGWGCSGLFVPTRYNSSRAKCVQCAFCHVFFSPNKFIFHCHNAAETGVQQQIVNYHHPEAANFNAWRRHLHLADPNPPDSLLFAWEDIKAMFNGGNRSKKASLPLPLPSLLSATCTTNSTITTTVEAVKENPNGAKTSTAAYAPPKRPMLLGATPLLPTDILTIKPQAILSSLVSQHTLQMQNYLWLGGVTSGESAQSQCGGSSYGVGNGDVCGNVGAGDSLSAWTTHLRDYFERVTQGIFLPPPPPPPPSPSSAN